MIAGLLSTACAGDSRKYSVSREMLGKRRLYNRATPGGDHAMLSSALHSPSSPRRSMPGTLAGEINEALELLERSGPEFTGGLSSHGPMAAEAQS